MEKSTHPGVIRRTETPYFRKALPEGLGFVDVLHPVEQGRSSSLLWISKILCWILEKKILIVELFFNIRTPHGKRENVVV